MDSRSVRLGTVVSGFGQASQERSQNAWQPPIRRRAGHRKENSLLFGIGQEMVAEEGGVGKVAPETGPGGLANRLDGTNTHP